MTIVDNPLDLFKRSGGLVDGHFVLSSGVHSPQYANKTVALAPATHAKAYARLIAAAFFGHDVDTVVGPELGAVMMAGDVRTQMAGTLEREVYGVVAEKVAGQKGVFTIGRDQGRFISGKNVLVCEDVMTSGASAAGTIAAVREARGNVLGVAALWNRSEATAEDLSVPKLFSVIEHKIPTYPEDDCPLCRAGVPVNTDLGKGAEFLARKAQG